MTANPEAGEQERLAEIRSRLAKRAEPGNCVAGFPVPWGECKRCGGTDKTGCGKEGVALKQIDEDVGALFAALDARDARIATLTEWRPIETAPKDEVIIICNNRVHPAIMHTAFWLDEPEDIQAPDHRWAMIDGPAFHKNYPTHWMPQPEPPAAPAAAETKGETT